MFNFFLCIVCLCLLKYASSQCVNDTNYVNSKDLIDKEKVDVFDKLLDEYGDVVGELESLLNKLSSATDRANQNLSDYETNNRKLKEFNEKLVTQLEAMFKKLQDLEEELHNLNVTKIDPGLVTEDIAVPLTTIEHLDEIDNKLNNWQEYVEKNNKKSLADDIMNIPHSLSDDITFLEAALSDEKPNADCLDKFNEYLKTTFEELSKLLNFSDISAEIKEIENISIANRESAEKIFNDTSRILEHEKKLLETQKMANDTVKLAEEINALKDEINRLRQETPEYGTLDLTNVNKLLKQLKQFESLDFDIEKVEKEIDQYQNDTLCYLKFIDNCHIKKASDDMTLPPCVKCPEDEKGTSAP